MSIRLEQFTRRKLFRWVLAYLAAAWLALQVLDVLGNRWDWPHAMQRMFDVLLIGGAFVTLVLAWFHGEKGQQRVTVVEAGILGGIVLLTGVALVIVYPQQSYSRDVVRSAGQIAGADAQHQDSVFFPLSSIAILPCANRTGDATLVYFVEGIHAELIDELANLAGLDVRARRSVLRFAGADIPLQQMAAALKVGSAMACEVFSVGDSVRIRTELLGLNPEDLLWSEAYDRETEDVVTLYRDVARDVAREVQVAISPAENLRMDETRTLDPNAYRFYLNGRYNLYSGTRLGRDRAVGDLAASISLDPSYAPAWAVLAIAYIDYVDHHARLSAEVKQLISASIAQHAQIIGSLSGTPEQPLLAQLARDAAQRAIALDPDSALSWRALAWTHFAFTFDFAAAMAAYDRALTLQPSNVGARTGRAYLLRNLGQWVYSLEEFQTAVRDDPLSLMPSLGVAVGHFFVGDPAGAIRELEALAAANPEQPDVLWWLALLLAETERYAESNEVLERQIPLMGDDSYADELALMGYNYGRMGLHSAARDILDRLDVMEQDGEYVSPIIRSFPHAGLGEFDTAFTWLNRALEKRDPWLVMLHIWPPFAPLRGDPRFDTLVEQVGLPRATYTANTTAPKND